MRSIAFLLVFLLVESAFAMRCTSVSVLEVTTAKAFQPVQSPKRKNCQLEGESALYLSGVLSSSLIRARGYIEVHFYDVHGKSLPPVKRGPWVRVFSNLVFDDALAVPPNTVGVSIVAKTESDHRDAAGSWRISELDVSPGIVLSASSLNGTVITTKEAVLWQFSTIPEILDGEFVVSLRDLEEREFLKHKVQKLGLKTDINLGSLPIGYYDVSVQFVSPSAKANIWKSGIVVLPEGSPPGEPRFGMDAGLSWYGGTYEMIENSVKMLHLAGIGTVRDRLSWSKIQPNIQNILNWDHYIKVAKIIEKAGLEQLQVFAGAPGWAYKSTAIRGQNAFLDEKAIYEFGQAYARGLGKIVRNIEFWNEPNLPQFFKGRPYQYANAMKAFYSGVKSEDKNIRVLIGSVANEPGRFFDEIYRNNAKKFFDVRNWHYYLDEEMDTYISYNLSEIEKRGGVSEKPGWLTERGYALVRATNGGWREAELRQSEFLVKTYVEGFANGYDRVFFFFWPELIEGDHYTWGILHDDFSPRPAYLALSILTRHLAEAAPEAVEKSAKGRIFFFKKVNGSRVAVVWGDKSKLKQLLSDSDVLVRDIFGKKLDISSLAENHKAPLLLSNITNLSKNKTPILKRKSTDITLQEKQALRLSGTLKVNGKLYPSDNNKAIISIDDNAHLEINGFVHSEDIDSIFLECISGKGISVLSSAQVIDSRKSFSCSFRANLSGTGESFIKVYVRQGEESDAIHIALSPDVRTVATKNTGYPLKVAGSCPEWVSRHSQNLVVKLDAANFSGICRLNVISSMNKLGDVWVFPSLQIPSSMQFNALLGLRLRISKIPGFSFPSDRFLLQLVEKTGGVWLVDLSPDKTGELYTGLFDQAYRASWKKDDNGRLDLDNLREIMIGWAAYKNTIEQRAFAIKHIDLLPKLP
jgi:hypothetical protein